MQNFTESGPHTAVIESMFLEQRALIYYDEKKKQNFTDNAPDIPVIKSYTLEDSCPDILCRGNGKIQ